MLAYRLAKPDTEIIGGVTVRISDDARKCVVFFGVPSSEGDGEFEYGGTGFLVAHTDEELHFRYLVTAKHVAKNLETWNDVGGFVIRVNLKNGASFPIPVERIVWAHHPDPNVDISVTNFGVPEAEFDVQYYNTIGFKLRTSPLSVVCGDIISIVGLFRLRVGNKKNVPLVHTGTIAAMPDPTETIPVKDRQTGALNEVEGYLVEAQTLEGLSGSPVFIHQTIGYEVAGTKWTGDNALRTFGSVKLLGLYQGAWDAQPGEILAKDRDLKGNLRVPVGVGIVVPAEKITEVIVNDPKLKKGREKRLQDHRAKKAAVADSVLPMPAANVANPTHREDFTSLLDEAARKREPKD